MQSVLIEYLRFDNLDTGVLMGGKKYILAHKDFPVKEVETSQSHLELLKTLRECLRYNPDLSNVDKWKKIVEISNTIKPFFISFLEYKYSDCQLDVVLNASELGLLPFELLLDDNEMPYFSNPDNKLIFTRRIRQNHFEASFFWPVIPKILFIYSHGPGKEVPFKNHIYELDKAVKKWGGKENKKKFEILDEGTFGEFAEKLIINDSAENHFTHVHILAHGALIFDPNEPENFEYGIAFGKKSDPVTPTALVKNLFESLSNKPFLVNYMICDGANFLNPMRVDKNPVQVTHKAGVPVVLGSQFPLSMDGSTLITKNLYSQLFNGKDIRSILYDIRVKLFAKKDHHHDWISLATYLRLPEGYNDYLYKVSLELQMQQLKFEKSKTDAYLITKNFSEDNFLDSLYDLTSCTKDLEKILEDIWKDKKYVTEVLENLGLLGSAYKRIAELHFIKVLLKMPGNANEIDNQKKNLQKSLEYYKKACDRNLSHYWSLVQYLSLDVVLNRQISDIGYWYAARTAIKNSVTANPDDGWVYGSLIELLLLDATGAGQDNKVEIKNAINQLIAISKNNNNSFLLESTYHQINRYKIWWTNENGFTLNSNILINDKDFLDEILSQLKFT